MRSVKSISESRKLPSWIAIAGIEPGGDQDEIRLEPIGGAPQIFAVNGHDLPAARASRKSAENSRCSAAFASTLADLIFGARARVPRRLVGAHEKYRAIAVKRILSAVPMMDVPIGNHYFPEAMLALRVTSSDRDVIEDAKSHALIRPGMMSGRSHSAKGIRGLASENRIDCIQNASDSAHRYVERVRTDIGIPSAAQFVGACPRFRASP